MKHGKRFAVLTAAMAAAFALSVVFAGWLANGSGSGNAKAGSAGSLTTSPVSAFTTGLLYPGTTGDVKLTINNPNPYPIRVTEVNSAVSASTPIISDQGAACTDASGSTNPTGLTFTSQTGLALDIPANGSATFTLSGGASMANSSANGCQGALFTIPVSLVGTSNA